MSPIRGLPFSKRVLAGVTRVSGLGRALLALQSLLFRKRYIRTVNYHETPNGDGETLDAQFGWYAKHFCGVNEEDLRAFLTEGRWDKKKPGLIISFDDGLRSNFTVARPLLEKHEFTGWFFVPPGFTDCPAEQQKEYAKKHLIHSCERFDDGRIAMSWEEVRELTAGHVVGCHTLQHTRMVSSLSKEDLDREIVTAKQQLESGMGRSCSTFCWVGGEEASYRDGVTPMLKANGYEFSFMTNSAPIVARTSPYHLQRSNIESAWPLPAVQFQVCGIMDLLYTSKRRRVNRLTA